MRVSGQNQGIFQALRPLPGDNRARCNRMLNLLHIRSFPYQHVQGPRSPSQPRALERGGLVEGDCVFLRASLGHMCDLTTGRASDRGKSQRSALKCWSAQLPVRAADGFFRCNHSFQLSYQLISALVAELPPGATGGLIIKF